MRSTLLSLLLCLSLVFCWSSANAKNILLLNSYQRGLNWSDEILKGVKQVTDQYEDVTLYAEYMDTKRFTNPDYLDELVNLYTKKYAGIRIDAVICADNTALDFVIKYAHLPIFSGYKVYCGVNNVEDYQYLGNEYKGVSEREFFMERFQAIKQIAPETETVYFLMDKTSFGRILKKRFEKVSKNNPYHLIIKVIDDIDVNELYAFVTSLKEKRAVIDYISITKDRFGENVNNEFVAAKIAKISAVPVFSNFDFLIGKGIVGGVYQLGADQGTTAATITMKLLSGTPAASIPNISHAPMRIVADYQSIKKFNLQLPSSSEIIILNQPQKIYVKYKSELIIALIFIVILIGIIFMLQVNLEKRRQSELRLKHSEQKFKDIAELLPQTIFECDLQGNLTFVNKQGFKMFGYQETDFKETFNISQLFLPEEREHIINNMSNIINGAPKGNPFFIARRKDGSTFPFEVHSELFFREGKPSGLRGIGIDITRQKETEQELIRAREKAEQSDKLKSAFLSNMSHEIRTPLNAIIGFSSLLSEAETSNEQRQEYKKYIQNSSEYLLNLINDIIDHSRIEAGQLDIVHSEFNLYDLMKELYLHFSAQQKKRSKEHVQLIYKNLDQSEQVIVLADPIRIKQIIANLLDNAFKFTDKGSIEFGFVLQDECHLLMTVKDTGTGISEEDKPLVFRRFYKLCKDNDKLYGGSGLGLSICKNLVTLMNGNIWLESEKGVGSTFYINIPVQVMKYKQVIVNATHNGHPANFNWANKTILIAEDELSNFQLMRAFLNNTGCEIIHARNGKEAVDFAYKNKIDLILMDIQMPVMNGHEAIRLIRSERPHIPIIAQTAYAMTGEKEEILSSGSNAYLSKPIERGLLLSTIHQFLG